ncbi:hypothetical protein [Ketogulonicigenium robustum]|uniref:hypothetical protein n=1 Tax=Ketogulonicigenium robustum TaxID=92947 RepID=UPI0012F4F28D|nr:hypothetical protein [Ketogulonicigenium robustum]
MTLTDIAAWGGLALGVINTAYLAVRWRFDRGNIEPEIVVDASSTYLVRDRIENDGNWIPVEIIARNLDTYGRTLTEIQCTLPHGAFICEEPHRIASFANDELYFKGQPADDRSSRITVDVDLPPTGSKSNQNPPSGGIRIHIFLFAPNDPSPALASTWGKVTLRAKVISRSRLRRTKWRRSSATIKHVLATPSDIPR